jgi:hypothetical protein
VAIRVVVRGDYRLAMPACVVLAVLVFAGCGGSVPSGDLISLGAAQAIAVQSTTSSAPVSLTSIRLSTYGREADGGLVAPAESPVWAVAVTGSFPVSCGPAPPPSVTKVCPPPQTTELVLIDARTGAFLQGLAPAPSRP